MHPSHLKELKGAMMRQVMKSQGVEQCLQWNHDGAKNNGVVPMLALEETTPAGEWGPLYAVGAVPGKQGHFRTIMKVLGGDSRSTMYMLPEGPNGEHLDAMTTTYHFTHDEATVAGGPLPHIRYTTVSKEKCPMFSHPNNRAQRAWKTRHEAKNAVELPEDPASDADGEEGEASGIQDAAEGRSAASDTDADSDDEPLQAKPTGRTNKNKTAESTDPQGKTYVEGNTEFFELDFSACKPNVFYVAKAVFEDDRVGLTVGKILSILDPTAKVFVARTYQCTAPCAEARCVTAKWHMIPGNTTTEVKNWEVIAYFGKLTKAGMFPKQVQAKLMERDDIEWEQVPHEQ